MSGKVRGVVTGPVLAVAAAAAPTAGAATTAGTAAAAASAQAAAMPHWRIVKQVKTTSSGEFTAVVATGRTTGWAFDGLSAPTAWERAGSAWTKVAFPSGR